MPICVLIDSGAVCLGGILGALLGRRLDEALKATLNRIFGLCSIAIGVISLTHTQTLPALVLSVVLGSLAGTLLLLERRVTALAAPLGGRLSGGGAFSSADADRLISVLVLFCASGTGIFGAIQYGATGDGSVLLAKSILDFFTAAIFASSLGLAVSAIGLPQCLILCALYLCGPLLMRVSPAAALEDFTACGGVLMLATGLKITGICSFPLMDMLPALVCVIPISTLWNVLF